MILSFRTIGLGKQRRPRSDCSLIRVCTVCHSVYIFWTHYSKEKPPCSNVLEWLQQIFRVSEILGFLRYIWAASWQNQQNGMCAQRRLRSAWASAQSDQSLCCPDAQSDLSLHWAHMPFCWFCHEVANLFSSNWQLHEIPFS